ncbi:MurR/RpiR family transcriptional regulator [Dietzia sp. CH92]|uniref:MurR/RpiR family transcriptional regulator n=1 Tax=Dietzia sp. CH92 TaxID=3051823 RepID=UPI0028D4551F|nr:MurR/RpiR family transcriptional regulator [Dietzia sp. CH92]
MGSPDVGATIDTIRLGLGGLHPGERRVAEEILARPGEVADLSAADLGQRCNTSAATVVRACKSLGFQGFQHLRMLLVRDAGAAAAAAAPSAESAPGPLDRLLEEMHQALVRASHTVDREQLHAAAEMLAGARRIVLVGSGTSASLVQWGVLRFSSAGIPLEAPTDPAAQIVVCRLLGTEDVCLAMSDSGMNRNTVDAVRAARKAGAGIVSITGHGRTAVAAEADISLVVQSPGVWNSISTVGGLVQALVLGALQELVADRRGLGPAPRAVVEAEIFTSLAPDRPENH